MISNRKVNRMEKKTKIYKVDGINMQFDSETFEKVFKRKRKKDNVTVQELETNIGEYVHVSRDAVHSWRFYQSGPATMDIIKELSEFFEFKNYKILLKEVKNDQVKQITERQKDSLKIIYDAIIDFLILFDETDGFNNLWYEFVRSGVPAEKVENKLYEFAEDQQTKIIRALQKEYIILHKLDLYPQLEEYVNDDLCNIYNEKLSYAYRFEAGVEKEDGTRTTVTTFEDYTIALNKINDLLDPYMN